MALKGVKVLEMAGLAPAPMCGMILADFGAQVTRIDKVSSKLRILEVFKRNFRFLVALLATGCPQGRKEDHRVEFEAAKSR